MKKKKKKAKATSASFQIRLHSFLRHRICLHLHSLHERVQIYEVILRKCLFHAN